MTKEDKIITVVCVIALIASVILFSFIDTEGDGNKKADITEAEGMLGATRSFLSSGKNTMVTAEALYANLNDGYSGNDPFILSVRGEEEYAKGHIPGAVNIPWRSVFTEDNISKLPKNKEIVVYCYTGHTASQITALLNMDGYDAVCLKWGMCSWTTNASVTKDMYYTPPSVGYKTISGSQPGVWSGTRCGGDEPAPAAVGEDISGTEDVDLRGDIHNYLASGKSPAISAGVLYDNLNDGDSSNDPFILSIRSAAQYEIGHIPGAVNIGFKSLFTDDNISKLPEDKQIVVVCYTGHTASQATALLNVNGYDAIALKFGMTGWSSNSTVAPSAFVKATAAHNYEISLGNETGDMETAVIADTSEVILTATQDFLKAGKSTMITAEALYNNLNDNYAGNDPFVLSIRSPEQYAIGHIPGAVNIPYRSVFTDENISMLSEQTGNKDVVVVCYTGHTASQVTAMLNVLGFNAQCLKWGMCSWTTNTTVAPSHYTAPTNDYPVAAGPSPGSWPASGTRQCGGDDTEGGGVEEDALAGSVFDIVRPACNNYLAEGKAPATSASSLNEVLNDGNDTNDPYLLSIRSSSQYDIGHIPGAVNIGFTSLFDEDKLSMLPTDRQIIVICYTGHTASQATALLNINGYDAIALKWGMTGWTSDAVVAPSAYNRDTAAMNYPVVMGDLPGGMDEGIIADPDAQVIDATNAFLSAGKGTMITAEALYSNLNDGYSGNDPFILSVRSEEQYAKGHIPGAANIPWTKVFTEENISKLPMNKDIIVYCYTGHTASQVTAMLNVMGYDALCLKWGMCSWTSDTAIAPSCYQPPAMDYPVASGDDPGAWTRTRQCGGETGDGSGGTEMVGGTSTEVIRKTCNNYLMEGKPPAVSASSLYERLEDNDTGNDPFVLSIRSSAQYSLGHIPGAVNIGMSGLFEKENLSKLPADDQQIVVVCYTGHTASQATALLNINGYNATALKWGMTGWTSNATVAPSAYDRASACFNYPVVIGENAGTMEEGIIADTADVILEATNGFLSSGGNAMITAEALYANLNDGYSGNDPFILSIRSQSAYEGGHIPGAVNIPYSSVFTEENISALPTDKPIVVYCFTGHTASQATAMLNVLGFDAVCLKWGMCSWTTNTTVAPSCYDPNTVEDRQVISGSEPGTWTRTRQCGGEIGEGGTVEAVSGSVFDITRAACNNYMAEGKPPAKSAADIESLLDDGDPGNDPFVLSIRSSAQYAIGHIPGAINIGMSDLFTEENMALLPDDDTLIVVVCYTGHTASQATALLNINGYNATALKWGMTGWTTNSTVAPSAYQRGSACHNYPVMVGSEAGYLDGAELVAPTDEEIILEASSTYLEGGAKFITADSLYSNLDDGNSSNDPFILSIRNSADYVLGHIPGAVNIPWKSLFSVGNLSLLPQNDTQVVVVCYTGQTASQITALLNVLGFNASALKHGMCSWTTNTTVAPSCFNNTTHQNSYPTVEGNTRDGCGGEGGSGGTYEGSADEWEMLRQSCERYVNEVDTMYITAEALYANLNDGYGNNDPYIISIRGSADYQVGHIEGAVNIPAGSIFSEEFLSDLPMDRPIVVYCYTGQGACHVAALLNLNGYDALSLKWGMCSWTDNSTVNMNKCYDSATSGHNYPVYVGGEVGTWEEGVEVA